MADMTPYENKYRHYLEDETDTYLKPEGSTSAKIIAGTTASVGLLAGGLAALKSGKMQSVMHSMILKAGRYRRGKVNAFNNGIRKFSQNDDLDKGGSAVINALTMKPKKAVEDANAYLQAVKSFRSNMQDGMTEHRVRMERLSQSELVDSEVEIKQRFAERKKAREDMVSIERLSANKVDQATSLFDDAIMKSGELQRKEQELMLKQTGFRHATIGDLIAKNELNEKDDWIQDGIDIMYERIITESKSKKAAKDIKGKTHEDFRKMAINEFKAKRADSNIFIDSAVGKSDGNLADMRDLNDTFNGFIHSLTTDFTIPLVKINPLRMFYLDHFFSDKAKPLFHLSTSTTKNPIITGHNAPQGSAHLFVDGTVYDLGKGSDPIEKVADNIFLADAQKGPIARLLRNMSGISISSFNRPEANAPFMTKLRYDIQSFFDVGLQDEPSAQFDFFDPTSYASTLINKVTGRIRMDQYVVKEEDYLSNAFGKNKDFIYMRKHRSLKDSDSYKDYLSQFSAGRNKMDEKGNIIPSAKGMQNVTLSTMFPYGFFERLNATLNQINLGLSNKAQGSAVDIFGGLVLKRIAPIWAGVELWDYLNYESENLLGFQFEDSFAQMYADSSVETAKVRDNLGITEWAKGISPLIVGGEHIADIPFLGNLLDWNDSAEELEEYWENGEDPVRKGRWWQLGNTPYTGGKIDYFEPNWVRRTLSDYEFTETQHGSREEYFENSWMPSLRHPLAPIRHFFTDPYHYEEKHYQERPYMMTGGIPELENFPLIGPVLNSTIGQLLKPQKLMHPEAWTSNPEMMAMMPSMTPPEIIPPTVAVTEDGSLEMPYLNNVSMPVGYAPSSSGGAVNTEAVDDVLASYVTSSGNPTVMVANSEDAIWDIQGVLAEKTPVSTGNFRINRPTQAGEEYAPVMPDTTASLSQMTGNLHYNMGEMGGFYGFIGFSATGEIGDERPIIQSSSDMSSYTRAFWDMDMGGFGGDANEIFRRFLPADRKLTEINTVMNTMPDWLPGSDYFIDFQTGDPYTKVKKGEMRLPGEAYESLYNIDSEELMNMDIGASFIGYDDTKIRDHMLKNDAIKDEALLKILDAGTSWHKEWERDMKNQGISVSQEQYVKDEASGIGGFYDVYAEHSKALGWLRENAVEFTYYKASDGSGDPTYDGFYEEGVKISDMSESKQEMFYSALEQQGSHTLIDPKTRGTKAWDTGEMYYENVQQVNFYGNQMETNINYLIHVDRQDPNKGIKVFAFETNPALMEHSNQRVENVRQGIRDDISAGTLNRGNLYDLVDRYRILADTAPYSQEFRDMKSQIPNMGLDEDEMEEIRTINQQVTAKKEKIRLYPYRFKTAEIEDQIVTVDHVIDNNTFMSKENPDNPIRLAGIRVSTAKDNPLAAEAGRIIGQSVQEGAKLRISYDANEGDRIKDDTYKTIQAVVYDQKGRNLNKYLLDEGLATEKENDYSAAAVHARFTPNEIHFGSMWESFAHMDTIIHTKMLQVRSPIEQYERREVYGKDWQEWTDPVEDFLIPAIQNSAMHNPLIAIGGGAFIGAAFGSIKSSDIDGEKIRGRYGKIVGGFLGASVMGLAVLNRMVHQAATGERWIPERREEERDTEEYFDVLKYIKSNALYNRYAEQALKQEGFDVKEYIEGNQTEGSFRKKDRKELEALKRQLYNARPDRIQKILIELEKYGISAKTKEEAMTMLNKVINDMMTHRELQEISPIAAKAMMHYQASKQTMYGYETGDPISNILAALPKKDRDYLMPFIESPHAERERILQTVPDYMKRVLQSTWGLPVDEKLPMAQYFKNKPLPGANWEGWRENVSLEDVKVKFVDNAGLDPSEFDIWEDDQRRAEQSNVRTPDVFNGVESAEAYSRKLKEILTGFNVQGVQLDVVQSNKRGIDIEMDIDQDRRDDVQTLINREGYHIL